MADAAVKGSASGGNAVMAMLRSSDFQLTLVILGVGLAFLVRLPPLLLDIALTVSITISMFILLVSIYIREPLEFSTFPTLLLGTTIFRLALNVATTKSILLEGASGHVSDIVNAFGQIVVGGNYFVGLVVFAILVIINFMVITKGAGRVAEVGARFTLDAMPGKQMAIDNELSAGHIDRDEAKKRRTKIEREADFYGSMDGASKYVRGDAIAGLIITAINIVIGLTVGVLQHGLSFGDAAQIYTLLTIGDGLVSQIPALLISTAAGIVVTRVSGTADLSGEMSGQLFNHPKAWFICSAMLAIFGLAPGMPFLPFAIISAVLFFLGRHAQREAARKLSEAEAEAEEKAKPEAQGDQIEALLEIDTLALEVGVDLVSLVDRQIDGEVLERIVSLRRQMAQELGIIVPKVLIRDNTHLRPDEYHILLKGNVIGKGRLYPNRLLAMGPSDVLEPIDGIKTKEPAFGIDAVWILSRAKSEAEIRNYTVVTCATVITTHLQKLIQEYAHDLVGRQDVHQLIEGLRAKNAKVVEEVLAPDRMTLGDVVRVLQNLLVEGVSVRDLLTIFESLADHCKTVRHPDALTRHVRKALGRGIIKKYTTPENKLFVMTLDRSVEDLLQAGLMLEDDGSTVLRIDPSLAQGLLDDIFATMKNFDNVGTMPIVMCGPKVRWDLAKMVHRFVPGVAVISWEEIPADVESKSVGLVSIKS